MRKKLIITTLAVTILLGGSVGYALTRDTKPVTKSTTQTQQIDPVDTTPTQTPVAQNTQTTTQPTTTLTAPTPAPAPAPLPDYGEDPNNPGVYIVFNKTSVMTSAGVPIDQQTVANQLISTKINLEWHYQSSKLQSDRDSLCGITPEVKMAQAGADYEINPITQLKYCNTLVQARYGSWQGATSHYTQTGMLF